MERHQQSGLGKPKADSSKNGYLILNLALAVILPVLSIIAGHFFEQELITWELAGKWIIFWAIGIRLFTAGISQATNPTFTANIFRMRTRESYVVIRELGFANISMGIMGILSVINTNWRMLAALTGGTYLGLAGVQHLFKKADSRNEVIAMVYDIFVLLIVILYLSMTLFNL